MATSGRSDGSQLPWLAQLPDRKLRGEIGRYVLIYKPRIKPDLHEPDRRCDNSNPIRRSINALVTTTSSVRTKTEKNDQPQSTVEAIVNGTRGKLSAGRTATAQTLSFTIRCCADARGEAKQ